MKRAVAVVSIVIAAVLLIWLLPRQGNDEGPVVRKVMVLGMDGLEWDVLGPMVEAGRVPNLARLIREGSWGELRSLDILESPVIWTSIATGKVPEKHGITGFVKQVDEARVPVPVTSNVRKVKAIWNILSEAGLSAGIVGWLATWPAEELNGYLVTSYFEYESLPGRRKEGGVTYPEELEKEIAQFKTKAPQIDDSSAAVFFRGGMPGEQSLLNRAKILKRCIASDETFRRTGLHLIRENPTDFFSVYMRAVDGPCHKFWVELFPESGPRPTDEEIETFGEVIPRYYEYVDSVIGEFLCFADDNTTVIVTSDHGHSGPKPEGDSYRWGIAMHDTTGVVVFWGKDIVRAQELTDVSVLDITPTVLALYGLPVADDMDGRVLVEAIEADFLESKPVTRIDTYEHESAPAGKSDEPIESSVDDQVRERLRALGYIE